MCGIAGTWFNGPVSKDNARAVIDKMTAAITHRGPDAHGEWLDPDGPVALGHRRLSIIDLSPLGAQPMLSADGRFAIAYNGEVYNFPELRKELIAEGCKFRGDSDTEVILEMIARHGVRKAVERFIGMFAFAAWDIKDKKLYLVRDRLGIKPLYYGRAGKDFVFGSELKSIVEHPEFRREIDTSTTSLFFHYGYFPSPHCVYKNVKSLRPGEILSIAGAGETPCIESYWSPHEAYGKGAEKRFAGSVEDAEEELELLLGDSVKKRMVSDVPLGAFLSGGIDSSTVVALMQAHNSNSVNTYTVGFEEEEYNEADFASAVAKHLGTNHTEMSITPGEAMAVIPRLGEMYDEPFADPSQVPTYIVSALTRKYVTVALSGDGGDELFCGYNHYRAADEVWRMNEKIPRSLRAIVGTGAGVLSGGSMAVVREPLARFMKKFGREAPNSEISLRRWSNLLSSKDFAEFYRSRNLMYPALDSLIKQTDEPETVIAETPTSKKLPTTFEKMMYYDTLQYMPDDILAKVDRASMSVALEVRVPVLDHRVVEFAASLPLEMKLNGGTSKYLLKRVLARYVPRELFERPKKGFAVPVSEWVRGPLRDWAEDLLRPDDVESTGILKSRTVGKLWNEHLGGRDHFPHLWAVLMFQAWRKRWL